MNTKTTSIIALVCGIVGIVGLSLSQYGVVFPIIGLILAIAGIVFGAMGIKKAKANGEAKGLAVAGMVIGIVGAACALIGIICAVACYATLSGIAASGGDITLQ